MSWRERAKRVDLTIVEEEKEKEWITPINRAINDSFFFFERRKKRIVLWTLWEL